MFCEKCGAKIDDDSVFCTKCGAKVGTKIGGQGEIKQEVVDDKESLLTVKPKFKALYMLLPTSIVWIFIMMFIVVPCFFEGVDVGLTVLGIGLVILLIILGLILIFTKIQYKHLTYDFYKTKVIFCDSFLNFSQKEVKYKYIREATMRESFVQRWFRLGTIVLYTNAETGIGNGISIVNVENPKEVYAKIKELIG